MKIEVSSPPQFDAVRAPHQITLTAESDDDIRTLAALAEQLLTPNRVSPIIIPRVQ